MTSGLSAVAIATMAATSPAQDSFLLDMEAKVRHAIVEADNIDESLKLGIVTRWEELVARGFLVVTGTDKEVRPYFVHLQGVIESVLATELKKSIQSLQGFIHTPAPATPLCTAGSVSPELVAPSVAEDPLRAATVKARATILRDYLFKGGDLYIAYPKEGIKLRNPDQQGIYTNELTLNPSHLFDRPLAISTLETEQIGAFYLFKAQGKSYAFAIKMTQANNPLDAGDFGLWFGESVLPPIKERIELIQKEVLSKSIEPIPLSL